MSRFLLLIFLSSWSTVVPLSLQCETGVAHPELALNVAHSLLANADVALLRLYHAEDVNACMNDCCTEKFGSCTVVSFKKGESAENSNCRHFNCRPVTKCRYLSSDSTDSFSFSSAHSPPVPSRNASSVAIAPPTTHEGRTGDDNTAIKPRKGVGEGDDPRKGVKPRKGVSLDTVSNIKPRKGVGPSMVVEELSPVASTVHIFSSTSVSNDLDMTSALERVFEDDPVADSTSLMSSVTSDILSTSAMTSTTTRTSSSVASCSESSLKSSYSSAPNLQPSASTPDLLAASTRDPHALHHTVAPSKSPSIFEHSKLLFHESSNPEDDPEEAEKERRYQSSMHLVMSLVFGLLVLFVVLGVVAKRVYDGWLRRHYRRMDFLIDGMYNGDG